MAEKKDSRDSKGPRHEPPEPDSKRPKHRPEGREHQVHKEILEKRWRGGPNPTADTSRQALEQWKNLPGSVVRPPTDVSAPSTEQNQTSTPDKADEDKKDR
jgi:hypothetical protein